MATLSGTKIKDTYTGLLKLVNNAAVDASLERVTTGEDTSTALQLSTTTVKADALQIENVSEVAQTKTLVWNSSTKSVGFREIPSAITAVATIAVNGGSSNGVIRFTDNAAANTDLTFNTGNNIQISGDAASNTITIKSTNRAVSTISPTAANVSLNPSSASGAHVFLDLSSLASGGEITLPPASEGLHLSIQIKAKSTTATKIKANTGDHFKGRIVLMESGSSAHAVETSSGTSALVINIDSNGASTGGGFGDVLHFICEDATTWFVYGTLFTSGTITTTNIFSAS
jgi:hypothetical protein